MAKSPDAFRTISEVADDLDLPQHVLRFWETRFTQIKPMKRGGGRRYYRPDDIDLLRGIRFLLYGEGYTIRGVQRILKEQGPRFVIGAGRGEFNDEVDGEHAADGPDERPTGRRPAAGRAEAERVEPSFAKRPAPAPAPQSRAAEPPPRAEQLAPAVAAPSRPEPKPEPRQEPASLSAADIRTLEATLAELLDCKRLLDQAQ